MKRREFLQTLAAGAAVGIAAPAFADSASGHEPRATSHEPPATSDSLVVAVRNGDAVQMFKKGIAALGGMGAFVKAGQTVCIKPNIAWDCSPESAANTNPELVGEIVRACKAAGAKKVVVFDHTCNDWRSTYNRSGIRAAVEAAGGEMIPGNDAAAYVERSVPAAVSMRTAKIHKAILESDVFINVPVLKHHGGAKLTAAMKNLMGIVWDRGFMHAHNLPQCIADSCLYRKPALNIVDAYRVMFQHGPHGVSVADTKVVKYQLLSRDIVAIDAMAAKLMRWSQSSIPYLALAEKAGTGVADEKKFTVTRVEV